MSSAETMLSKKTPVECVRHFRLTQRMRSCYYDILVKSLQVDPSGEIMLLPQSCPWKDHLFSVEEEQEILPTVKFVLFTDQSGKWRVQCVPKELFSFDNR